MWPTAAAVGKQDMGFQRQQGRQPQTVCAGFSVAPTGLKCVTVWEPTADAVGQNLSRLRR